MEKVNLLFLGLVAMVAMSVSFSGCGKDDGEDGDNSALIGKWEAVAQYVQVDGKWEFDRTIEPGEEIWTFYEDYIITQDETDLLSGEKVPYTYNPGKMEITATFMEMSQVMKVIKLTSTELELEGVRILISDSDKKTYITKTVYRKVADSDEGEGGGSKDGVLTVTDIPSRYNGKYVSVYDNNADNDDDAAQFSGYEKKVDGKRQYAKISDGQVKVPLFDTKGYRTDGPPYKGNDKGETVNVLMYNGADQSNENPYMLISRIEGVDFTGGSATVKFVDPTEELIGVWKYGAALNLKADRTYTYIKGEDDFDPLGVEPSGEWRAETPSSDLFTLYIGEKKFKTVGISSDGNILYMNYMFHRQE
jgi:hypothetical protein